MPGRYWHSTANGKGFCVRWGRELEKKGVVHRRGGGPRFLGNHESVSGGRGGLRGVEGHAKSEEESRIKINVNDTVLDLDNDEAIEILVDNFSEGQFF